MSRCFSCDPSFGCFTAGSCRKGEPELRATISTLTEERDDLSTRLAADRDRLRALLAEAVGIAGLQDDEVTPEIRERLAAIAREGGLT